MLLYISLELLGQLNQSQIQAVCTGRYHSIAPVSLPSPMNQELALLVSAVLLHQHVCDGDHHFPRSLTLHR